MPEFYCGECRRVSPHEQPQCPDSHQADCPEWLCVACGAAVFLAVTPHADQLTVEAEHAEVASWAGSRVGAAEADVAGGAAAALRRIA